MIAESIVERDPFIAENYYQENEENNWLLADSQTKMNIKK